MVDIAFKKESQNNGQFHKAYLTTGRGGGKGKDLRIYEYKHQGLLMRILAKIKINQLRGLAWISPKSG